MAKSPDKPNPVKDPEFQKVVQHFLKTPPKRHDEKPSKKRKGAEAPPRRSSRSES